MSAAFCFLLDHAVPIVCGSYLLAAGGIFVLLLTAEDVDVDLGGEDDLPSAMGRWVA